MLVREAVSLFQWGRLATLLIVIVMALMDKASSVIRNRILRAPGTAIID